MIFDALSRRKRLAVAAAILLLTPAVGGIERALAPDAEPWPRWEAHNPRATATIDHAAWDALLARRVVDRPGANLVRYAAFDADDRRSLDGYIDAMQAVRVSGHGRDEQLAYWINLYNALTLRVVLDHHPVASIRDIDISPGILADGPWGAAVAMVEGVALSLNDIEHRILRPVWNDPRIHYGVNCAAIGCPDLQARAFTGAAVHAQLDAAARSYVNDPRGVAIEGGRLTVSKIYDWFHEDFGRDDAAVIAHLRRHADPALAERLAGFDAIDDAAYDWSLNDAR
jgi:hypothetical protein